MVQFGAYHNPSTGPACSGKVVYDKVQQATRPTSHRSAEGKQKHVCSTSLRIHKREAWGVLNLSSSVVRSGPIIVTKVRSHLICVKPVDESGVKGNGEEIGVYPCNRPQSVKSYPVRWGTNTVVNAPRYVDLVARGKPVPVKSELYGIII